MNVGKTPPNSFMKGISLRVNHRSVTYWETEIMLINISLSPLKIIRTKCSRALIFKFLQCWLKNYFNENHTKWRNAGGLIYGQMGRISLF